MRSRTHSTLDKGSPVLSHTLDSILSQPSVSMELSPSCLSEIDPRERIQETNKTKDEDTTSDTKTRTQNCNTHYYHTDDPQTTYHAIPTPRVPHHRCTRRHLPFAWSSQDVNLPTRILSLLSWLQFTNSHNESPPYLSHLR